MSVRLYRRTRFSNSAQPTDPDQLRPHLGDRLVLGERDIGKLGRVAREARVRVAEDVGLPLPTGRVWVAGADVFGLEPLELLLGTKFVGL